jgi:hypothetical protein
MAAMGCGDDDCPACPESITPLGYAIGSLFLDPGAHITALHVYPNGAVSPNLDSVKVGDSLVGQQNWTMFAATPFADAHCAVTFHETGNSSTYMYDHGDIATIEIWGQGRSSTCQLRILYPMAAIPHITDPLNYADTIAPGASDTVFWNTIEYIDYYAVMIAWEVLSEGGYYYTYDYYYSPDTSFVISGAMQPPNAIDRFNVYITPFTGPDPQTGRTNWTGTLLDGVVYSYGIANSTTIVVNTLTIPPKVAALEPAKSLSGISAAEIVDRVYKKYGR